MPPAAASNNHMDLEYLSKPPLKSPEANDGACESGEGIVDVDAALISDGEPPEPVDRCEGSLDHPPVSAKALAAVDAAPGDAWLDAGLPACGPAAAVVIGLVSMELVWPASRTASFASHRGDGIEQQLEWDAVVDVGAGQDEAERNAAPVGDQVAPGAGSAAVGRVRTCRFAPLFAATDALSMQAQLQSMRSASCRRLSSSRCNRSHRPACCQSRSRRQQVTPEPHPNSSGSISHPIPVRSTNKIPVRAARAGTRGRPPFGFGRSGGSNGDIKDHSSSGRRGQRIPPHKSFQFNVQGF